MKIIECDQATPEWWAAKRGIPSASNFDRIITPVKGELSKGADDYIAELIADRHIITPVNVESYTSRSMAAGIVVEPEARKWYELETGKDIKRVGVCITDDDRFCASPDGLIGDDGCLELKCPDLKTQVKYLLEGGLPATYRPQVHGQLIVTGRAFVDFVSYAPGLPKVLVKVTADEYTDALRQALEIFYARYQEALKRIEVM